MEDVAEILGVEPIVDDEYGLINEPLRSQLDRLHLETETALQIILSTGEFTPGTYINEEYTNKWTLRK